MIHRWKGFDLEITGLVISMIRHPQVKLYHLKPQTLKQINFRNISDKPTYDTSLERP